MPTVAEITRALERRAPPASKLDFDRVGLQIGEQDIKVDGVLIALDLTPEVVTEAESVGANLIVTHHPLLFRPLNRLVPTDLVGGLAYRLARAGIAYYALHTNLDVAPGGVSFALAEHLGLRDLRFLRPTEGALLKLVTYVPPDHVYAVRMALAEAGAGQIGDYEACSFMSTGTGTYRPGEGSRPFQGEPGRLEAAQEVRLEVEVSRWGIRDALSAMQAAHPYEEVAYDLYPVEKAHTRNGLGAVGLLTEPETLGSFLDRVSYRLNAAALRYVGDADSMVYRVAVCGGAGASLIGDALATGADAYVTGDITYHTFFEALGPAGRPRMALVDAGHYETEWVTEQLLVDWIHERFPYLSVARTSHRTSPIQTHVPRD